MELFIGRGLVMWREFGMSTIEMSAWSAWSARELLIEMSAWWGLLSFIALIAWLRWKGTPEDQKKDEHPVAAE
jgi:hypothetical protein